MRFILVLAIWIIIVGGLWSYIAQRDAAREQITQSSPINLAAKGTFTLEITPTFSTESDPFALTSSEVQATSFTLRLNGTSLTNEVENLERGQSVYYPHVVGMLEGHNEIYIEASPPLSESSLEHGIRLKLFKDDRLIVDKTIWAEQGALVVGTISYTNTQTKEADHDH